MKSKQFEYFKIWQPWLIWNTVGAVVTFGAMAEMPPFFFGLVRSGSPTDVSGYSNPLMIIMGGILAGWSLALSQAKGLPHRATRETQWILANILGFTLSYFVMWLFAGGENTAIYADHALPHAIDNAGTLGGVVMGATVGTAQWIVLRKHFRNAFVWIIANIVGFTIGWQLAVLQPTSDQIAHFVGALMVGITLSLTTSIALFYLMKLQRPEAVAQL